MPQAASRPGQSKEPTVHLGARLECALLPSFDARTVPHRAVPSLWSPYTERKKETDIEQPIWPIGQQGPIDPPPSRPRHRATWSKPTLASSPGQSANPAPGRARSCIVTRMRWLFGQGARYSARMYNRIPKRGGDRKSLYGPNARQQVPAALYRMPERGRVRH